MDDVIWELMALIGVGLVGVVILIAIILFHAATE
jgi:hypothetical protein